MKTLSLLTLVLFSALSCKGQEPKNIPEKTDTLIKKLTAMHYIPNVNSNFEKFDFQKTKDEYLKNLKKKGDLQNPEAKLYSYSYTEKIDDNRTIYRDYYEVRNKKDIKQFGESYPLEITYYNNSSFKIRKFFYPNGNIKEKGLYIVSGGFNKGIWYYFNQDGKLTEITDYDKKFKYSWEEVEKFMEKNKIPMPLGNIYIHGKTKIYRSETSIFNHSSDLKKNASIWSIIYKGDEYNQYKEIILDADTGKILIKKTEWMAEGPGDNVPEPIIEDFTAVYITHEGKPYTKEEWKAFEQEHHNEYLRKNRREDEIQPVDTPKTDDKKRNFLADEDDIKPQKKKGFWDSLFD